MQITNDRMMRLLGVSWECTPRPRPGTRLTGGVYSTDAVDLTLGPVLFKVPDVPYFDPIGHDYPSLQRSAKQIDLRVKRRFIKSLLKRPRWWLCFLMNPAYWGDYFCLREGYLLYPGEAGIIGHTRELVHLFAEPLDEMVGGEQGPLLTGTVDGKSCIGRIWVAVHQTAQTIHNGTKHHIALEFLALKMPVLLRYEMPICQLRLSELKGELIPDGEETVNGLHAKIK